MCFITTASVLGPSWWLTALIAPEWSRRLCWHCVLPLSELLTAARPQQHLERSHWASEKPVTAGLAASRLSHLGSDLRLPDAKATCLPSAAACDVRLGEEATGDLPQPPLAPMWRQEGCPGAPALLYAPPLFQRPVRKWDWHVNHIFILS